MKFKEFFNKAVKKASEIKDSKPVIEIKDKTIEYLTEPKSAKEHLKDGAINTVLGAVLTGGASIPVAIAWAAGEEVIQKAVSKTEWAKKIAAERRNKKDGPKPQ